MNILFFTESGMGVSALTTEQICVMKGLNGGTFGVVSGLEQEPGLIERMRREGIELLELVGLECHRNWRRHVGLIRDFVRRNGIEVIHVQTNWELVLCFFVKLALGWSHRVRIVYTLHAFRNDRGVMVYVAAALMNLALLVMADRVVCISDYTRGWFRLVGFKTVVLPLGVDSRFFLEKWSFVEDAGMSMVYLAQFRKGKRHDWIIRAFADFVDKSEDGTARLFLPGEGPTRRRMMGLAEKLGVADRVVFPGRCSKEEVFGLLSAVNIAVVASCSETFGQCIAEPFVMGKLVISTPVGIAPEIIRDGVNGFIFDSAEELSEILCNIAGNKDLMRRMGWKNFEMRGRFDWRKIVECLMDEYEKTQTQKN